MLPLFSIFSHAQITVKEGTVITGMDFITAAETLPDKENTIVFISEGAIVSNLDELKGNRGNVQIVKKVNTEKQKKPFVQKKQYTQNFQSDFKSKETESKSPEVIISSSGKKSHFFSENRLQIVAFSGHQNNKKKHFFNDVNSPRCRDVRAKHTFNLLDYFKSPILTIFSDFCYSQRPPPFT